MRNKTTKIALALGMLLLASQAQADQLADIKAAGVVKVATFDANPPFGSVDAKTHHIVGYDVDFAQALAKALGVKLELVATNPANRIPLLQSGKADLIVADITITPERAQVIDFSTPYFVTGQQFLVPAGSPDKLDEYSKARIGAVKGTTGEQALHQRFPQARVLSYDDIPLALTALRNTYRVVQMVELLENGYCMARLGLGSSSFTRQQMHDFIERIFDRLAEAGVDDAETTEQYRDWRRADGLH